MPVSNINTNISFASPGFSSAGSLQQSIDRQAGAPVVSITPNVVNFSVSSGRGAGAAPQTSSGAVGGGSSTLTKVQTALSVIGFVPVLGEIADVINAGISFSQGDISGGLVNLGSAIPFAGNLVAAVKVTGSVLVGAKVVASTVSAMRKAGKRAGSQVDEVAEGLVTKGPKIGGGGTLDKLSPSEIKRIQNAANRSGQDIGVVGSRVNPNKPLHSKSDYDFVIDANSKTRNNLSRSLPGAKNVREGIPNNQDIFKGTVDASKPHIIFRPE